MKRPSLSLSITIGLVAGLAVGILAARTRAQWLMAFATGIEPIGTVWINLLRMVVIPLVVAALVSGVASLGDPGKLGRVGLKTVAFFLGNVVVFAVLALAVALIVIPLAQVPPETAAQLRAAAAAEAETVTAQTQRIEGVWQFVVNLVPTNPVKAAVDGALLPLIVFSALFGAAVGGLPARQRAPVVDFSDAVMAALVRFIVWVMVLAPIGVFCLVAPVTARFGWELLRSMAVFVLAVVLCVVLFGPLVYGLAAKFLVRVPSVPRFARDITPGAAVAFTTTSSLAAVPAMMETAVDVLKLPRSVASFVIPLAAAVNRPGTAVYQACAVVFIAGVYGIPLSAGMLAVAMLTSVLMTFSVAGIPSATVFTTAPVLMAAGLPPEGIALLLGIDRIPDMFRTGMNGVAHQVAAAAVARGEREPA